MGKRITISDVAKTVGVSKSTVSYVLSGKKSISDEVVKTVHQAIETLGYTPRVTTPKLSRKLKVLTFCIPQEYESEFSRDPYYLPVLEGAYSAAAKAGYGLCIHPIPMDSPEYMEQFFSTISLYDGIVLANLQASHLFRKAIDAAGVPCVLYGRPEAEEIESGHFVDVDTVGAGYQVTRHLVSKGHQSIFYMEMNEKFVQSHNHINGYKIAHKEAGISWDDSNLKHISMENCEETIRALIAERSDITAFVVANNILARTALSVMISSGVTFPGKKALIGLGGNLSSYDTFPRITTVDYQPYLGGETTVNMLIDLIEGRRIQASHVLIPGQLIEQDTV